MHQQSLCLPGSVPMCPNLHTTSGSTATGSQMTLFQDSTGICVHLSRQPLEVRCRTQSWWQATTGVKFGGLGFRTARSTALAAFVASRTSSRLLVKTMVEHFHKSTGADVARIMLAYDSRTEDALVQLVGQLPSSSAMELWSSCRTLLSRPI